MFEYFRSQNSTWPLQGCVLTGAAEVDVLLVAPLEVMVPLLDSVVWPPTIKVTSSVVCEPLAVDRAVPLPLLAVVGDNDPAVDRTVMVVDMLA